VPEQESKSLTDKRSVDQSHTSRPPYCYMRIVLQLFTEWEEKRGRLKKEYCNQYSLCYDVEKGFFVGNDIYTSCSYVCC